MKKELTAIKRIRKEKTFYNDRYIPQKVNQIHYKLQQFLLEQEKVEYQSPKDKKIDQFSQLFFDKENIENLNVLQYSNERLSKQRKKKKSKKYSFNKQQMKNLESPGLNQTIFLNVIDFSTKNLLSLCLDNQIYGFNYQDNKTKILLSEQNGVIFSSIQFHNKFENFLSAGDCGGNLRLFDLESKKIFRSYQSQQEMTITAIQWNNYTLIEGNDYGQIHIRDIRSKQNLVKTFFAHSDLITNLHINEYDNNLFLSESTDKEIQIYDIRKQQKINSIKTSVMSQSQWISKSNIVTCQQEKKKIFNTNILNKKQREKKFEKSIQNVQITAEQFVLVSSDKSVLILNQKFDLLDEFNGHNSVINTLKCNKNRNMVLSGSMDDNVIIWDVKNKVKNQQQKKDNFKFLDLRQFNQQKCSIF